MNKKSKKCLMLLMFTIILLLPLSSIYGLSLPEWDGLIVDQSAPIGQLWTQLGGVAVLGAPLENETDSIVGGKRQKFENGVILYSEAWGAFLHTNDFYDYWITLDYFDNRILNRIAQTMINYLGQPIEEYNQDGNIYYAKFERGMVIFNTDELNGEIVFGELYPYYVTHQTELGLPIEPSVKNGAIFSQKFENADLIYHFSLGLNAVFSPIREYWYSLGGSSEIGWPMSEMMDVKKGNVHQAYVQDFENGSIYLPPNNNTYYLSNDIQSAYIDQYNGALGWLGLPVSAEITRPSGVRYVDFQNGVLVRLTNGDIWAFQNLNLYIQRFEGAGGGWGSAADLYVNIALTSNTGYVNNFRRPSSGDWSNGSHNLDETVSIGRLSGGFELSVRMEAWDADWPSKDDHMGKLERLYTIDNLWGILENAVKEVRGRDGVFRATYSMQNPIPYESGNIDAFRQNMWWSFNNFPAENVTYNHYAATFSDAEFDDSPIFHPFNHLFYQILYKSKVKGGCCFGMSLESIYAQLGRSLASQPIHRYWLDTQDGSRPDQSDPVHLTLVDEIIIKQGYQLQMPSIAYFIETFFAGRTRDAVYWFYKTKEWNDKGEPCILSIIDSNIIKGGHALRPYKWEENGDELVIYIADPNLPYVNSEPENSDRNNMNSNKNKVVINKANNTFIHDSINGHKFGNSDGSYRMLATPFYLVNKQNPSPMEYLSKLLTGVLFIVVGDTAEATQIEDGNGNQYYKADPDNPDQTIIEEEPDLRIPDFSGIPVSDYSDGNEPVAHLYYGEGENRSFKYDLRLRANIPDGTEFEWCMDSGTFGAKLIGEGSREFPCRIKVDETKSTPSITYTASEALESNLATITLAAGNKEQWIEFRDMKLIKGQSIKATVKRAGKEAVFETDGPDITGTIVVKNGKESEEIVVGEVTVKSGESTRIEAEAPKVHHYLSETNYGENDWLIAPVKIELIAEDFSQTGIKLIEYSLDKSVWNTYEEPFIFDINGESTIFYRAMDNSYHKSQIRSIELKIDMVPPQVEVSFSQFSYTRVETASLSYSVIDPSPGSGISNYTALYNNQEVKSGYTIDLFWQPLGTYTLTVTAIDNAGHKTTKTAQYALKADLSGFAQTVDQLYSMNEITQKNMYMFLKNHALNADSFKTQNPGFYHGMLDQIENKILRDKGDGLTERAADLLLKDIEFIRNSFNVS